MNQDMQIEATAMMLIEQALSGIDPDRYQYIVDAVLERLAVKQLEKLEQKQTE